MGKITTGRLALPGQTLEYELERKRVKNLNLRVRPDGSVHLSAPSRVPMAAIEAFLREKSGFVLAAQNRFRQIEERKPGPRQYVTGERYAILGQELTLEVRRGKPEGLVREGGRLLLTAADPEDTARKQRLMERWRGDLCRHVFGDILTGLYPIFEARGVAFPQLRIRTMTSRWGSCLVNKGIITLNSRLIEMPLPCIEYVAMHEYCHFIHPDHSARFHGLMTQLMPDWEQRKQLLNRTASCGL